MFRTLLKSKIHRATVTDANLAYEGSVTIDTDLMVAADVLPYEAVTIWDVTNGARLETYAIPGKAGSGVVCINGAAAHQVQKGDIIIIASYAVLSPEELVGHVPRRILVDDHNRILSA